MRIISGKARGTKLTSPPGKSRDIRPTSDRCKEALFSILADKIKHARVIDLFAGTGSLGLESLSRGAQSAVFIDNSKSSLSLVKKNSLLLQKSFADRESPPDISIIKGELPKALVYILRNLERNFLPFDIVFLDPPYEKGFAQTTLEQLDTLNVIADQGIVVVEELSKVNLADEYETFTLINTRKYGDTTFWLYEKPRKV